MMRPADLSIRRRSGYRAFPRLEALEDRFVLTTFLQFSASVYQVANTQQSITITVTRVDTTPSDLGATVDFAATPSTRMEPPARPNIDFTPVSGTLEYGVGTKSQSFDVPIMQGGQGGGFIQPVFYVDLTLSNPLNAVLGTPNVALLKITTTAPSQLKVTPFSLKAAQNVGLDTEIAEVQDSVRNLQAESYKAIMSWGDGTAPVTLPLQPQGNIFTVNGTHTFALEGTFTYTLTVIPANGKSVTMTGTIVVGGFVTGLYNDLFDRAPDQGGLQFWDRLIAAGASRQQVALLFWNSPEHQAITVEQFYQSFYGRSADPAGLAYWTNVLTSGTSGSQVAIAFSTSPEFLVTHPTNALFASGVYLAVEGSLPAPTNLLFGQIFTAFNAGVIGRADVTAAILGLPETYSNAVDQYFQSFLDRAPDAAGKAFYTSEMLTGNFSPAMIGSQILGSIEYLVLQNQLAIGT